MILTVRFMDQCCPVHGHMTVWFMGTWCFQQKWQKNCFDKQMICNFTYFSYPRVSSSRITNLHWPLGVGTYFCSVSKICKISNMANFLPYNFTNHSVFGRQKQRDFPPNLQSWRWKSTVLNVNSSIHFSYFLFSAKLCHMS